MAFEIAGRMATRQGMREAKARLMEPIMKVDVITPEEYMGTVVGDVNSRRGLIDELSERGGMKTVAAKIPLSCMFQYVSDLRSMTKGRAQYSMVFDSYAMVPGNIEKEITEKYKPTSVEDSEQNDESDVGTSAFSILIGLFVGSGTIYVILI